MDLYKILKIKKTATPGQIKSSYRKLSKKHHPDMNGDAKEFDKITVAYKVLINKKRRKIYDKYGVIEDNNTESKIKTESRNNLAQLLKSIMSNKQLMNDHHKVDILDIMISSIKNNKINMKTKIKELAKDIDNINGLISKFIYDGSGDNILISVLKTEISDKELIIRNINHEVVVIEEMKKLLNDYNYELETLIMTGTAYTTFSGTANSTSSF
jgi:hypothetical protein